jgi:hypothetical protein
LYFKHYPSCSSSKHLPFDVRGRRFECLPLEVRVLDSYTSLVFPQLRQNPELDFVKWATFVYFPCTPVYILVHVSVYPKCSLRRVMDKQVDGTLCDLLCNRWTVASLSRDNPFQPKRSRSDVIQPSDVTCMPSFVNTPEPLPKTLVTWDAVFAVSTVEMDH